MCIALSIILLVGSFEYDKTDPQPVPVRITGFKVLPYATGKPIQVNMHYRVSVSLLETVGGWATLILPSEADESRYTEESIWDAAIAARKGIPPEQRAVPEGDYFETMDSGVPLSEATHTRLTSDLPATIWLVGNLLYADGELEFCAYVRSNNPEAVFTCRYHNGPVRK